MNQSRWAAKRETLFRIAQYWTMIKGERLAILIRKKILWIFRVKPLSLINSQIDLFRSQTTLYKGNARFPILYVTMATYASRKHALIFILCILTSHFEKLMNLTPSLFIPSFSSNHSSKGFALVRQKMLTYFSWVCQE